ncbi:UNVERIFIED_CONTAM: hypothetical protein GTU68_041951 [Idotea baltica]|nr:hypothetical protein [Idotea baltica]
MPRMFVQFIRKTQFSPTHTNTHGGETLSMPAMSV